jgi:hypothetical protein
MNSLSSELSKQSERVPFARATLSASATPGETIHPSNEKGVTPRKDDAPFLTRNDLPVAGAVATTWQSWRTAHEYLDGIKVAQPPSTKLPRVAASIVESGFIRSLWSCTHITPSRQRLRLPLN